MICITSRSIFLQVIDNLKIAHIEVRVEDDPAIAQYVHKKQIEFVKCDKGGESLMQGIRKDINDIMKSATGRLHHAQVLNCLNADKLNTIVINEAKRNLANMVEDNMFTWEENKSLSMDIDELNIFISIRKDLSDNLPRSALAELEELKANSNNHPNGLRTSVQSMKFSKLLSTVKRAQVELFICIGLP